MDDPESFYIGYLPHAPASLATVVRRFVLMTGILALGGAVMLAIVLPYFGAGEFEFGRAREFAGTLRCDGAAPRLSSGDGDFVLVGYGKRAAPVELCGGNDRNVVLHGTRIHRDGRELIEVERWTDAPGAAQSESPSIPLGRFTLKGEIVDAKCYFGVMNPGEGRVHRACAELCLRGGVPAVFVTRDRSGGAVHLLVGGGDRGALDPALLPWVGLPVEITGEITRRDRWFAMKPDLASVRAALR